MKILIVAIVLLFSLPLHAESLSFLAAGDTRGHLEPCGCHPDSDLGGLVRLDTLVKQEKAKFPKSYFFYLGNLGKESISKEKWSFLNDLMLEIAPDAFLPSALDLKLGLHPKLPVVLSNQKKPQTIVREELVIYGFLSPPHSPFLSAKKWLKTIQADPKRKSVLLFRGTNEELRLFEKSRKFDLILSGSTWPEDKEILPLEKENPALLQRSQTTRQMPVGSQGVLRGGALTQTCGESGFFGKPCKKDSPMLAAETVTWLGPEFERSKTSASKIRERYKKWEVKQFQSLSDQRRKDFKPMFAGSDSCQECHSAAHKTWTQSGHAKAFQTLVDKNSASQTECLSCHVLGYAAEGGFIDSKTTPQLKNVQCENCHGAALKHISSPAEHQPLNRSPERTCSTCHHGQHSPHFSYSEYWKKIKHGPN